MTKFSDIQTIKENFDDRLYQVDEFKATKGILNNFSKYITDNKAMLIGLLAATSINAMSQLSVIKDMDFGSLLASSQQYETVIQQKNEPMVNEIIVKSDFSEMNLPSNLETFKNKVVLSNSISNANYLGQHIPKLTDEGILSLKNLGIDNTMAFKNPFWENNVLEIENSSVGSRFYHDDAIMDANLHSAKVLSVHTEEKLIINFSEVGKIADFIGVKNEDRDLILKYVIYHEAAHGSFEQSHEFNPTEQVNKREVDLETHADLASIMMISSETKNLNDFNKLIDYAMEFRMKRMQTDISHNTTFALAELKQLVNKNPELLHIKPTDISTFSATISNQVNNHVFSDKELNNLKQYGVDFSEGKILKDMKERKNDTLYNSWSSKFSSTFNVEDILSKNPIVTERQLTSSSNKFANEFKKSANHDVVTSMMNANNNWDLKKTTNDINEYVKNHSILDQSMQSAIDYKVQIDKLTNLELNQARIKAGHKNILDVSDIKSISTKFNI
jgi:hypothetical protein